MYLPSSISFAVIDGKLTLTPGKLTCLFEPNLPLPKSSSFLQRIFFYFGIIIMFLAFPITLPLALFLMKKAPR